MSTPTQRHTSSSRRMRRGQLKLKKTNLSVCPKCKKPILPHRACANCGTYKMKQIFKVRIPKKFRKKKEKEQKQEEKKASKDKPRKTS